MPEVRPNPVEAGGENKSPAGESLLRTKLFVPALRARRVRRSRLIDRLDQAFTHPLTLVSAPARFGKTTLLVEWILKHNQVKKEADPNLPAPAFCWLSLEESDNDPARFLSYLIAAVESALGHALTGAQSMLHAPQTAPVQSILGVLINELIEIDLPLIVVLDDYHTITQAAIQAGMVFLLDHLPPNMHLILATRVDPPLSLARWRGRDQILELRTDDLRFDPEETLEFLRQAMELDLSAEEVAILGNRTEGWITGLQMAAIAIKSPYSKRDPSRFIQEFNGSHRYILEYLVEEVLQRQPEEIQTFLLYTSVLDRLCAPLCEAVMQEDGETRYSLPAAVPILESLDRLNLFIVPLDSERRWFRYHHLFADLLRARLHQAGPDRPPRLHRRASAWFEENGFLDEAIQHAFKAKDYENAARLLEQSVYTSLTHGELATLLARIQAIPEDILRGRASLCVYLSAALIFAGKLDEAGSWLEIAEPLIRPGDNELQGNAAIYRALIADLRGEMAAAVQLANQAEQLLPAGSLLVRSLIPFILGDGYFGTGDMTGAGQAYEQIHQIGKVTRNPWTISVALAKLASVKKIQGRLHEAMRLYQEVFSMADELGGRTFGTLGASYIGYSDLLREWNELAKARQQVVEAIANMEDWVSPTDLAGAYTLLARLEIEQGNLDQAAAALNKAEQWTGNYQSFRFAPSQMEACQARLWLAYPVTTGSTQGISTGLTQGLEAARRWAGEKLAFLKQHAGEAIDLNDEPAWIALARVLIAVDLQDESDSGVSEALGLLEQLAGPAEAGGRFGRLIEISNLQALALDAQGKTEKALQALEKSLRLAEPEGFMRIFIDEGEPMRVLIAEYARKFGSEEKSTPAAERDPLRVYLCRLLSAFPEKVSPAGKLTAGSVEQPDMVEKLSERELEVLKLICSGYSNQEIAGKLVITMNTVKRHNNSIFGKLGVKNRAQAIVRARQLGYS